MELCENGSLFDLLHEDEIEAMERMQQQQQGEAGKLGIEKKRERRGPGFKCDEKWLIDAATDVARAMSYLHGLVRRRAYVYMHDEKLGQRHNFRGHDAPPPASLFCSMLVQSTTWRAWALLDFVFLER